MSFSQILFIGSIAAVRERSSNYAGKLAIICRYFDKCRLDFNKLLISCVFSVWNFRMLCWDMLDLILYWWIRWLGKCIMFSELFWCVLPRTYKVCCWLAFVCMIKSRVFIFINFILIFSIAILFLDAVCCSHFTFYSI